MDEQLLRVTLQVARARSFAAVARDRDVDPSSVSRQVAAVEQYLGIRIFERTTRRLDLTEAGALYLARLAPALELMDEAADVARDVMRDPSGLLRVSTSVAFGERWLMPRITAFRQAYPDIELELMLSDALVDLASDGVDVALRLGPQPTMGTMVMAKLFDTAYRVVASPTYVARAGRPRSPIELEKHDGLLFALPAFRSAWRFCVGDTVVEALPRASITISNALAVRRAALAGMGVALLAEWTVDQDLADGTLVDLFPDHAVSAGDFDSAAWIVYPSRAYVPTRLRVFIDHLRKPLK
ncbi:LysR family transcriptional regulator [Shimia sp. NS0008-38b]|uniref:LysR family transcriptional regulator n=1 Tax=Shimia sp. NS0008-38b TaxID=3127653 RepID=UPI0033411599